MEKNGEDDYSFNSMINLTDIYSQEELKKLKSVFPKIYSLLSSNNKNSPTKMGSNKINNDSKTYINKFKLCQLILENIKCHFMEEKDTILVKSITFIFNEINNLLNILSKYKTQTKLTKNIQNNNLPKISESKFVKILKNNEFPSNKNSNNFSNDNKTIISNSKKRRKNRISQISFDNFNTINYSNYNRLPTEIEINYDNERRRKKLNVKTNSIINNFITITSTNNNRNNINYHSRYFSSNNSNNNTIRLKRSKMTKDLRSLIGYSPNKDVDCFYTIKTDTYSKMKSFFQNKKTLFNTFKRGLKSNNNSKNNTVYNSKSKNNKNTSKKLDQKNTLKENSHNCIQKNSNNSLENNEISINNYKEKISENTKELRYKKKKKVSRNILKPNNIISTKLISTDLIESKDFNIFEYDESIGKANTLTSIGYYIFNKYQFNTLQINQEKFENWSKKITEGYNRKNPYHTDLHASDVTQACLIFYQIGKMDNICKFDKLSLCSLFLSCMCHDFKHPGVNNNYLKETKNILAERYNDQSILENMHISETFKLTNHDQNCNIFSDVDSDTYKKFRKNMIACVLSTDMFFHGKHVDFMKNVINNKNSENFDNNENYLKLVIHSADISNSARPYKIYIKWAKLVFEEFCLQGDKEKKLGLPMLCDREKSFSFYQLSFLVNVIQPFMNLYIIIFHDLGFIDDNLQSNIKELKKHTMKEKEKEKK